MSTVAKTRFPQSRPLPSKTGGLGTHTRSITSRNCSPTQSKWMVLRMSTCPSVKQFSHGFHRRDINLVEYIFDDVTAIIAFDHCGGTQHDTVSKHWHSE